MVIRYNTWDFSRKDNTNYSRTQIGGTPSGEHYDYLTKYLILLCLLCIQECSPSGVTPSGEHSLSNNILVQATTGKSIFVYSEDGMLLQSVRVNGNQTNISLPQDALYVIKVGSQVMKLRR